MTKKQIIFRDYLLKRLGFQDSEYLNDYLDNLSQIVSIYKGIAGIDQKDWNEECPKPYYYFDFESGRYFPEHFKLLDFLVFEYKQKKEKSFRFLEKQSTYLSATDLANYTYCPIGYSIGRTFEIPKNQLGEIGKNKHEEHRLINSITNRKNKYEKLVNDNGEDQNNFNPLEKVSANEVELFFNDIDESELIFSGHTDNENSRKYFINEDRNFKGQPDYIFKNKSGQYFVVEEKFKRMKTSSKNYFFRNHKVQLASYMYFLNNYDLEYGYLIYWLYDYNDYQFQVDDINVLKLNRSQSVQSFLESAYKSVTEFNEKRILALDINGLNAKKCANCVYVLICGHKNKRRSQVTLPYQLDFLNLYWAEYPDELKV
jgi:CRISPR/Cas system-associated exonuclease Cas4 (RecB family)